ARSSSCRCCAAATGCSAASAAATPSKPGLPPSRRGCGSTTPRADVDEPTLSVTELNTTIRDAIRGAIPENVWVRGEVQGFRESRAGHVYFQLVEKDEGRNR